MKNLTLPYHYNLPLALVPTFAISSSAYVQNISIGSWNLNRTVNWRGIYRPTSFEEYMMITATLCLFPALLTAAYFIYRFVKRQDVSLPYSLGILLLMTLFCFLLPPLI